MPKATLPPLIPDTITLLDGTVLSPAQWLGERDREYTIGASDLATIARVHGSIVKLWYRKRGLITVDEADQPEQAWWGKFLETCLATRFELETGEVLARRQVFVRHPDHPWLAATLDALTASGISVEIKLLTAFGHDHEGAWWNPDRPPAKWVCQAQQQMAILGTDRVIFVVLYTPTMTVYFLTIERDEVLWSKLFEQAQAFRQSLLDNVPPTDFVADDAAIISKVYRGQAEGPELELDDEDVLAAIEYYTENANVTAIQTTREKSRAAILQAMGTSTRATIAGYQLERKVTAKQTRLEVTPPVKITTREAAPPPAEAKPERMAEWLYKHLESTADLEPVSHSRILRPNHPAPSGLELQEFSMRVRQIARSPQPSPEVVIRIEDRDRNLWIVEERTWVIERFWGLRPWGPRKRAVEMTRSEALELMEDYPSILDGAVLERAPSLEPKKTPTRTPELTAVSA
jgi:YqaJ-like viral recombinase domain